MSLLNVVIASRVSFRAGRMRVVVYCLRIGLVSHSVCFCLCCDSTSRSEIISHCPKILKQADRSSAELSVSMSAASNKIHVLHCGWPNVADSLVAEVLNSNVQFD